MKIFLLSLILFSTIMLPQNTPHPNAVNISSSLTSNLKKDPGKYKKDLVTALVKGLTSNREKVKAIHDWIAINIGYDANAYFSGSSSANIANDVIKTGLSVCEGYSNVALELLSMAGFECVKITGFGKGYGYDPFKQNEKFSSNHAWNAVKIDTKWELFDVTWNSGYLEGRKFIKRYSEGYLFLQPELFIYTHYPEDSKYQFLSRTLSWAEFMNLPFVYSGFFDLGFKFVTPLKKLQSTGESYSFELKAPANIKIMANLFDSKGKEIPGRVLAQKSGEMIKIDILFPGKGDFIMRLYAKREPETGSYGGTLELSFNASKGTSLVFPEIYGEFNAKETFLKMPVSGPLKRGLQKFEVQVKNVKEVGILTGDNYTPLKSSGNNVYTGSVELNKPDAALVYSTGGGKLQFICKWKVE
ncbi:MAG: hypothetical protein IAE91_12585 [Ignavibacteriaceae bacterium]|nr:hypothetical protein [Ignavibacteriaceae bacterium]